MDETLASLESEIDYHLEEAIEDIDNDNLEEAIRHLQEAVKVQAKVEKHLGEEQES